MRQKNEELTTRINEFQNQLDVKFAKIINIDRETVKHALINFNSLFDSSSIKQKTALIRALIKRIEVEPDRQTIRDITFWFYNTPRLPLSNTRGTVS